MRVMKDERSRSRGFGFVNYANHDDAQKVVSQVSVSTEIRLMPKEGRQSGVFCCYIQHLKADMTDFLSLDKPEAQPYSPDTL